MCLLLRDPEAPRTCFQMYHSLFSWCVCVYMCVHVCASAFGSQGTALNVSLRNSAHLRWARPLWPGEHPGGYTEWSANSGYPPGLCLPRVRIMTQTTRVSHMGAGDWRGTPRSCSKHFPHRAVPSPPALTASFSHQAARDVFNAICFSLPHLISLGFTVHLYGFISYSAALNFLCQIFNRETQK